MERKDNSNWWCTLCGWYPDDTNWPSVLPLPKSYVEHGCNERRIRAGTYSSHMLSTKPYKKQVEVNWVKWNRVEDLKQIRTILYFAYGFLSLSLIITSVFFSETVWHKVVATLLMVEATALIVFTWRTQTVEDNIFEYKILRSIANFKAKYDPKIDYSKTQIGDAHSPKD